MEANNTRCYGLLLNIELLSEAHKVIFFVANSMLSVTTVITSVLVSISYFQLKKFRKPLYLILMVLSCTDCVVGVLSNSSLSYMALCNPLNCLTVVALLSASTFHYVSLPTLSSWLQSRD